MAKWAKARLARPTKFATARMMVQLEEASRTNSFSSSPTVPTKIRIKALILINSLISTLIITRYGRLCSLKSLNQIIILRLIKLYLTPDPSPACDIVVSLSSFGWRGEYRGEGAPPPLKFLPPFQWKRISTTRGRLRGAPVFLSFTVSYWGVQEGRQPLF